MKIKPFTLIEMLMVMGVMILLAAIAIPAYSSLFSGRKTTLAANQLNGAIMTARAHAVSSKVYTAILFAKNKKTDDGYTSYRLAEVYHNSDMDNNSFLWRRWVPGTAMTNMPDNVIIPSSGTDLGIVDGKKIVEPPRVTNLSNDVGGTYAPAIIIKPNGQLAGVGDKNMVTHFVEANRYKANKAASKLVLNINWLTCKVKYEYLNE